MKSKALCFSIALILGGALLRAQAAIALEKWSPEYWSGEGQNFSQWYEIQSDPAPEGYVLASAAFWLKGDRPCHGTESSPVSKTGPSANRPTGAGSWAECYEARRDENTVTWRFRMQGHDEDFGTIEIALVPVTDGVGIMFKRRGKAATSRGQLVTRYLKR